MNMGENPPHEAEKNSDKKPNQTQAQNIIDNSVWSLC